MKIKKIQQPSPFPISNIVDNLNSDSSTDVLSAKQGKILNERIGEIISSGSNEYGSWIKYSDGIMICYDSKLFSNINVTSDYWGFCNRTPENLFMWYPTTFTGNPKTVNMSLRALESGTLSIVQNGMGTSSATPNFGVLVAKNSTANKNFYIDYIAIGKWR